ncbi:TPA: hypothetical protein N0F65_002458 [Lagenidium giganteum]|uniref:Uncharacterized protein n=1 Tax=Lagenidium giganteum TaxID=4803 RepID=A0AAV2YQC6_9STRA|nr:TPA: hypothetical protein N0F65_002458 [Lagenidium giganteum]
MTRSRRAAPTRTLLARPSVSPRWPSTRARPPATPRTHSRVRRATPPASLARTSSKCTSRPRTDTFRSSAALEHRLARGCVATPRHASHDKRRATSPRRQRSVAASLPPLPRGYGTHMCPILKNGIKEVVNEVQLSMTKLMLYASVNLELRNIRCTSDSHTSISTDCNVWRCDELRQLLQSVIVVPGERFVHQPLCMSMTTAIYLATWSSQLVDGLGRLNQRARITDDSGYCILWAVPRSRLWHVVSAILGRRLLLRGGAAIPQTATSKLVHEVAVKQRMTWTR